MELLKHFEEKNKKFLLLRLKDGDRREFLSKLPKAYRDSYIDEGDLSQRVITFSSTKAKELLEILPSRGNIKSGDFGEILSYFLFVERHKKRKVNGPKKWRWKTDKNVAAPYSDVILFAMDDPAKPSKTDLLISVESKMKSVQSTKYHPIQDAIDGAEKDYVSRIANSLSWFRQRYKLEALKTSANKPELVKVVEMLNRFIRSEQIGEYEKKVKAIAFIDKEFFDDEVNKSVTIPKQAGMNMTVFAVSIKDLQKAYEKVFSDIPKI